MEPQYPKNFVTRQSEARPWRERVIHNREVMKDNAGSLSEMLAFVVGVSAKFSFTTGITDNKAMEQ